MPFASAFRRLATLAVVAGAACLSAQSFHLDRDREPVVSLDGPWRFHPGDSPLLPGSDANQPPGLLWAAPSFDDSSWPLLQGGKSWAYQGYPAMSGYGWYRFTVTIPSGENPTSLLLAPMVTSYEVYMDGKLAGGSGKMPPAMVPNTRFSYQLYPLSQTDSSSGRTVQVAIRVWHSPIWASYVGGGPFFSGSLVGDPRLLAAEQNHRQLMRNVVFVDCYAYSITAAMIGLAIFWLFLIRPGEREYLWFALMVLAQAADSALTVLKEIYAFPPIPIFDLLDALLNSLIVGGMFLFLAKVLHARLRLTEYVMLGLLAVSAAPAVFYWPGWCSAPVSAALQLICMMPAMLWILYLLVARALRGNRDAGLLLLPGVLTEGYWTTDNLIILLAQAGWMRRPGWMIKPLPLPPFTIHPQILLNLLFLLAMLIFLIRRFSRARRQEERLAGEFEAARQVQQVLLPDQLEPCSGFAVDCIYHPADEVGGDFFQQVSDGNGGILIVVGDVSGKGLPAAMMVSVLVGAIRAEAAHGADPAAMLSLLNDRVVGRSQGGFTTCLAAHITAGGELTLANAGHLPPYLNGQELGVPGSLPLGIVSQARYECTTVKLTPGDRLTFVSDGVVEAQSKSSDLFGFERTRQISRLPAARIAEAARAFGQLDDITVVTVEFSGAAVSAMAS
jgi:hypothetical protein